MRASLRWMSGVSGFANSLTALMKTRRPSASRRRAANPGEKPCGCVFDSTTREPRRCSSAWRTPAGMSSQWMRTPRAGTELEKDPSPELQVVVDPALDRVPDLVGEAHHQVLVLGRFRGKAGDVDRRVELDPPLARERDHAQGPKPRPERGDREVGQAEEAGDGAEVTDHRVDLLGPHDGERDDRSRRLARRVDDT